MFPRPSTHTQHTHTANAQLYKAGVMAISQKLDSKCTANQRSMACESITLQATP